MLDLYIIKEIQERERKREERPFLELPLPQPPSDYENKPEEEVESRRVIIIDTMDDDLDDFTIDL